MEKKEHDAGKLQILLDENEKHSLNAHNLLGRMYGILLRLDDSFEHPVDVTGFSNSVEKETLVDQLQRTNRRLVGLNERFEIILQAAVEVIGDPVQDPVKPGTVSAKPKDADKV